MTAIRSIISSYLQTRTDETTCGQGALDPTRQNGTPANAGTVPKREIDSFILGPYEPFGSYKVDVDWGPTGNRLVGGGPVSPSPSDDSGQFFFFDPDNWEVLVKVLDGVSINNRFWVFSAATTNVEYTLRVTDTETAQTKSYENPLGNCAPAITDTSAFATCP